MKSIKKIKVVTIVGTRPEIIRLSSIIKKLDKTVDHILVHTGQNYDFELNEIFFKDLGLKKPDYFLNADTSTLGTMIGDTIAKTEVILNDLKPDCILILGDTNSALSSIIAKRLHIPIFHMEAGNRSFDMNVPEEINRKIVDHISDFNLVYTEHARRHLLSEGLPHRRIYLTGSPMNEVINDNIKKIKSSKILDELNLSFKKYFIVSIHREENVDSSINLNKILDILNQIYDKYKVPVIVSTHPRTKKQLKKSNIDIRSGIKFLKPFSFTSYLYLQLNAICAISDSGTISEEASILSFPAISIRESMERPEAQDSGQIILSGLEPNAVLNALDYTIKYHSNKENSQNTPLEYKINNTSDRVLKLILGNAQLSNKWWGISK